MDIFEDLEKAVLEIVTDLKPTTEIPSEETEFEMITFDNSEQDNSNWLKLMAVYLNEAEIFEIHCWNEETEWIELALQYGKIKDSNWQHGKIITGAVTLQFREMLLNLSKPKDTEIYNKMTPFFNVFLDNDFQSCHYGTENYYK